MESARRLGIADRLTYLALPAPAAFCYGFLRPRIAITAALANRLGAEELTAVLLHERHHLQRRDPLRYLALSALTAGAFLVPLAPFLRRWAEARIELAADRAALTLVPREVLARALAATLLTATGLSAGMAGLSATEARIAHLAGRPELPAFPLMAGLATIALASSLGAAAAAVHGLTRRESPVTASSRP